MKELAAQEADEKMLGKGIIINARQKPPMQRRGRSCQLQSCPVLRRSCVPEQGKSSVPEADTTGKLAFWAAGSK